jgi:hypothetical protein
MQTQNYCWPFDRTNQVYNMHIYNSAQSPPPSLWNPQQKRILSPEVNSDSKVIFRLDAPAATEESVRSEWQKADETQKMAKGESGVCSLTVGAPLNFISFTEKILN